MSVKWNYLLAVTFTALMVSSVQSVANASNSLVRNGSQDTLQQTVVAPVQQNCSHRAGNVWLTITNWGTFGSQFNSSQLHEHYCLGADIPDNSLAPSAEFPAGTGINYLFQGALWIGAIVGSDTLVSTGQDGWQYVKEMYASSGPQAAIVKKTSNPNDPNYDSNAVSDADLIAVYYDTLVDPNLTGYDYYENRPHRPLGLKIRQSSYSWSELDREKFVIFRYKITNIGANLLQNMYVGIFCDADIWHVAAPNGFQDDISGCHVLSDPLTGEQVRVAWSADNDGDPMQGMFFYWSPLGVIGVSVLDFPATLRQSFNWWIPNGDPMLDWGPRKLANDRNFGTGGLGTPEGDRNKYYVMSVAENDYDQLFAAVNHSAQGWLPPSPNLGADFADGYDTRFLLSFGSTNLAPGDSLEFAFVVAIGDNFHRNPTDFQQLFNPANPQPFHNSLDFSDLDRNILAARVLYRTLKGILPGDADGSWVIDISDAVFLIKYVFDGGPAPASRIQGDASGDCKINVQDVVYLINYIFAGGPAPVAGCTR
jgi:hypothetical protein